MIINFFKKNLWIIILSAVGFTYRIYGLTNNYSFWTDEEHVAIFARAILERGKPVLANGYSTGYFQILQYWISAVSAKIFGLNEFALRLPSVIFGTLTIWSVFLLGKKLFNFKVGLIAAFFTTFLRIEIVWSQQARPYQALQFFFLLGVYFLNQFLEQKDLKLKNLFFVLLIGSIASLMHGLGIIFFVYCLIMFLVLRPKWFKPIWLVFAIFPTIFILKAYWLHISNIIINLGKYNNFFFYRVFLWFNYSLFVVFSILGVIHQLSLKKRNALYLLIFGVLQFGVASFLLNQPFTRYFYVVFPFIILLASYGLYASMENFKLTNFFKNLSLLAVVFFIAGMGWKFALKPRPYFPLNEDMQEIPQVDWKKIYHLAGKLLKEDPNAIFISNWTDLSVWFLGEKSLDYLIRTRVVDDPLTGIKKENVISNINHFINILNSNPKGVLVIDSWDNYMPEGVREYCRKNLKKETEIDRLYSVQPRYWPVEVYSWGLE